MRENFENVFLVLPQFIYKVSGFTFCLWLTTDTDTTDTQTHIHKITFFYYSPTDAQ